MKAIKSLNLVAGRLLGCKPVCLLHMVQFLQTSFGMFHFFKLSFYFVLDFRKGIATKALQSAFCTDAWGRAQEWATCRYEQGN